MQPVFGGDTACTRAAAHFSTHHSNTRPPNHTKNSTHTTTALSDRNFPSILHNSRSRQPPIRSIAHTRAYRSATRPREQHRSRTVTINRAALALAIAAATLTGCTFSPTIVAEDDPAGTTTRTANLDFISNPFAQTTEPAPKAIPTRDPWQPVDGKTTGISSAPAFAMFGELPNAHSSGIDYATTTASTENVQQVTFGSDGLDFDPTFSPTTNNLVFASTRHRPTADIYTQAVNSRSVVQLTTDPAHDVMPAVSPDGTRIAFASNRAGSWDIYVMDIEGGPAVQVTSESTHELHPTWSTDGQSIAFSRLGTEDRWEIWLTEADRPGALRFLTYGLFPEWQPGGNKIVFQRSRERGERYFSIWTVDIVNNEAVRPTEHAASSIAALINPTWSPDGSYIAYATVFAHPDDPNVPAHADVWVQTTDGSVRTTITQGWDTNVMPAWGFDGKVYFVSNRSGIDNIWAIGPDKAIITAGGTPPNITGTRLADVDTPVDGG